MSQECNYCITEVESDLTRLRAENEIHRMHNHGLNQLCEKFNIKEPVLVGLEKEIELLRAVWKAGEKAQVSIAMIRACKAYEQWKDGE